MSTICKYSKQINEDLYLCTKHRSYCYLDDNPDEEYCKELYGDEFSNTILDEVDSTEDTI